MSSWSYRGTDLSTLGTVTLVSDSLNLPKRRGSNITIPMQDGRVHVQKYFDERAMTLGLEIVENSIQALEEKMDLVKALFGKRSLGTLRQNLENGNIRNAAAEFVGDLNGSRVSPVSQRLVLDFIIPKVFFRSNVLTTDTQTIDASPKEYTLENPGTADERYPTITFTGPLSNVEIVNTTNQVSVKYNGDIEDGHYVVLSFDSDTGEYLAVDDADANVIGNITHNGDAALFVLNAGNNGIAITDEVNTTGTVTIEFYAPYL